jgi:hypothetical protein
LLRLPERAIGYPCTVLIAQWTADYLGTAVVDTFAQAWYAAERFAGRLEPIHWAVLAGALVAIWILMAKPR